MAALASALQHQRHVEFDRNETAMAASLPPVTLDPLSEIETALLAGFVRWAESRGVRHLPARPSTIAVWILEHPPGTWGTDALREVFMTTLQAISRMHELYSLADPVASSVVRSMLSAIVKIEAPRSWTAAEKILFTTQLTPQVQAVVARRETEREKEFRTLQNLTAEKIKGFIAALSESKSGEIIKPKDVLQMAREKVIEGPYSNSKKALKDMTRGEEFSEKTHTVISRVEEASSENSGYAGAIRPGRDKK